MSQVERDIIHNNGLRTTGSGLLMMLSVSQHRASVDLRERLALGEERRFNLLRKLVAFTDESVAITTCNRTEIYLYSEKADPYVADRLVETLATIGGIEKGALTAVSTVACDGDAVRHLFRVASGIDSAILGEPQILGQVRHALDDARKLHSTGPNMERLFQRALATGKRARSQTRIGSGAGSISHAAVQLARRSLGDLSGKRAISVGVGEMGCLVARNLIAHGIQDLSVCNRTISRAEVVSAQLGGRVVPWEQLGQHVVESDIVITATASDQFLLTPQHFASHNGTSDRRNVLVIDISVPRNVDPAVDQLPNVRLFGIDDLHAEQSAGLQRRAAEVPKVEAIVEDEAEVFMNWYRGRQLAPVIRELYQHAESIQAAELAKALQRLDHLGESDREAIRALAHGLTRKLLHRPVTRLKDQCEPEPYARALSELFDIEDD